MQVPQIAQGNTNHQMYAQGGRELITSRRVWAMSGVAKSGQQSVPLDVGENKPSDRKTNAVARVKQRLRRSKAVSYTHLTLPTILLV
eukprot:7331538-Pyramimonas_sp.AAC.1